MKALQINHYMHIYKTKINNNNKTLTHFAKKWYLKYDVSVVPPTKFFLWWIKCSISKLFAKHLGHVIYYILWSFGIYHCHINMNLMFGGCNGFFNGLFFTLYTWKTHFRFFGWEVIGFSIGKNKNLELI